MSGNTDAWLEKLPSQIQEAYCYLLSSPNDEWQEFVLNDKAIEIVCSAKRQSQPETKVEVSTMPEFTYAFGFAKLYEQHKRAIGRPTSEQVTLPGGVAYQYTTNGVLLYNPDSNECKFFKQATWPK